MVAESTTGSPGRGRPGRVAQRRRTRRAIVTATMDLLRGGHTPTIDQIAATAEVSRRTIYLHFPTLDHLLLDATAGLLSETEAAAELDPGVHGDNMSARIATLARVLTEPATLPLGRQIIALTVIAEPRDGPIKRGQRRIDWIERAIEPLHPKLSAEQHQRLVAALAVGLGWEAMVVLEDLCGLDQDRVRAILSWLARVIVDAMIEEGLPSAQ